MRKPTLPHQLLLILCFTSFYCRAQTSVGLLVAPEASLGNWRPLLGVVVEHQKTRHSGFETGLQYRSLQLGFAVSVVAGTEVINYTTTINEHHLTLPILYKFYSRIVNFAVGPSLDLYLGYSGKVTDSRARIDNYTRTPTLGVGALFKVSKTINLSDKILLEPEARVNPILNASNTYAGFGVAAKYQLGK